MPQPNDRSSSLQKYATARETRSSAIVSRKRNPGSDRSFIHDTLLDNPKVETLHSNTKSFASDSVTKTGSSTTSQDDGTDDSDHSAGALDEDGDNEEDDDETEAFAPSGMTTNNHGRQTGRRHAEPTTRHLSKSNKRRWSTSGDEEEQIGRSGKVPRLAQDHTTSTAQSEDEDYNGVDLISDSDEGEPTLEKMEERMIIDSEEENGGGVVSRNFPTSPPSTTSEDWRGIGFGDDSFLSDIPFFDEQIGRTDSDALANALDLYRESTPSQILPSPELAPTRRVRFADDVSHSSDSRTSLATVDNSIFPDLFMNQDSLDPTFRQLIENDDEDENHSITDGEGSYWDLDDNEDFELERHGLGDDSSSNGGSSSGYETDEGETTDEEVLPPKTVTRPQSLLRLNSSSTIRKVTTPLSRSTPLRKAPLTPTPAMRRNGPSMASWIVDPTKPIAVIDSTGKTMLIYAAPRSARKTPAGFVSSLSSSTTTSPKTSFATLSQGLDNDEVDRSDLSSQEQPVTMIGSGANLMLSGLLHGGPGSEHILGGQVLGPPEAFYPFTSMDANGLMFDDEYEEDDDDDDDPEYMLNLQDFIDFGDSSDSELENDMTANSSALPSPILSTSKDTFTPVKSGSTSTQQSSTQNLLQHFDKGVVSSFRRNQTRHQSLLRRPNFSSSFTAIKGGRHIAANTPISPLRKRKAKRNLINNLSPFQGVAATRRVANKIHKRSKSTS
ncbi:hypothetical protein MMC11_000122 [Xylographa trunciseda]|nr:hypothetical protein [Xylographa trunciseda]